MYEITVQRYVPLIIKTNESIKHSKINERLGGISGFVGGIITVNNVLKQTVPRQKRINSQSGDGDDNA